MAGTPPFQNVAESNLAHWGWKSEVAHSLSMCCFGMYTATGVPEDFVLGVGPAKAHTTSNENAKFGVLETSGEGVTLGENRLKAIENQIEAAGVSLRIERAGNVTATASALESERTNAGLRAVAQGFSDSIGELFQAFAEIIGLDAANAGSATVNDDFGTKKGSDAGLQELGKMRALGDISRNAFIAEMIRRDELATDFDLDVNSEEISSEMPDLGGDTTDNMV